jgi:predicted RNA-binding Zn-ribbon protein involved in translation (DUF1610 family)
MVVMREKCQLDILSFLFLFTDFLLLPLLSQNPLPQHGAFNRRLRMKAESCGKVILDIEEHGTSITCSSCGQINRKLGSTKVFKCPRCEFQADRDINSSKNHLLKTLVGKKNY